MLYTKMLSCIFIFPKVPPGSPPSPMRLMTKPRGWFSKNFPLRSAIYHLNWGLICHESHFGTCKDTGCLNRPWMLWPIAELNCLTLSDTWVFSKTVQPKIDDTWYRLHVVYITHNFIYTLCSIVTVYLLVHHRVTVLTSTLFTSLESSCSVT